MMNDANEALMCTAISECLEPISSLGEPPEPALIDGEVISPLGFWGSATRYEAFDVPMWYPMNYFGSEKASNILLDAMLAGGCIVTFHSGGVAIDGIDKVKGELFKEFYKGQRKSSLVLAAFRWLGLNPRAYKQHPKD